MRYYKKRRNLIVDLWDSLRTDSFPRVNTKGLVVSLANYVHGIRGSHLPILGV